MAANDSGTPRIRTRFRRYECKYLIPPDLAAEIRSYVRPYVAPDPYAAASPDRSYDVSSLYLDSSDLRLYWETVEGQLSRIKLRIRSYDESPDSPMFLEIKRRFDRLVLKRRARMDRGAVASMLAGVVPDTLFREPEQQMYYDEFVGWMDRWLAEPQIWVRYHREAYVGTINRDVRVTMDRDLMCAPANGGIQAARRSSWQPVETRQVVLEVKFDESFPEWVARLVQRFQLEKRSYSKYGHSVRRGLANRLVSLAKMQAASS